MSGRRFFRKFGKKDSKADPIWCHLCKSNFEDYEVFRLHIMQKHRPASQFYEGNSDSNSELEEEPEMKSCVYENLFMDMDSDEENFEHINSEIAKYDQNLYNNISETAVSPQSCTSLAGSKGKKNCRKMSQNNDQLEGNKAAEQVDQSSPQLNHNAINIGSPQLNPAANSYPQFVIPNNQLQYANPYSLQEPLVNGYFGENLPVLQYQPVINPTGAVLPITEIEFVFNAKNIVQWYNKLKRMGKSLKDPLPTRYLKKIIKVNKTIFDHVIMVGVHTDAEKHGILRVYQELNDMISRNAICIGQKI